MGPRRRLISMNAGGVGVVYLFNPLRISRRDTGFAKKETERASFEN